MIIHGDGVALSRWANGVGETRELYVERDPFGRPRWRLSMATMLGSGEFSRLPGVQRSLLLVNCTAFMQWGSDAAWTLWHPGEPVVFDGDLAVRYQVTDGGEDLGCMVWGGPAAPLEPRRLKQALRLDAGRWRAAVVTGGTVLIDGPEVDGPTPLGYRDTVICDGDTDPTLAPGDDAACVVLVAR